MAAAERSTGVVKVLTHLNTPRLQPLAMPATQAFCLPRDRIQYEGQPVAIVVADILENATRRLAGPSCLPTGPPSNRPPHRAPSCAVPVRSFFELDSRTGDPNAALAEPPVRLERTYRTADRHHNPMELSATITHWEPMAVFCGEEFSLQDLSPRAGTDRSISERTMAVAPRISTSSWKNHRSRTSPRAGNGSFRHHEDDALGSMIPTVILGAKVDPYWSARRSSCEQITSTAQA